MTEQEFKQARKEGDRDFNVAALLVIIVSVKVAGALVAILTSNPIN